MCVCVCVCACVRACVRACLCVRACSGNRCSLKQGDRCVDVAVKTLRKDIEKKDRVLFLQEAAITGQFKHKNIVQLHGVVAHEETVRQG